MTQFQPVRGTHDLLPDDYRRYAHVVSLARGVAERYGYAEMAPPIFEFTDVFARTMGETSDVVTKEMYSFDDRGGEGITLRPEFTAGIARGFISNGLYQQVPMKVFAHGPAFRYERPQKGRQRQFHQFDIEVIGSPEPGADIEVIAVGADILRALGVLDRTALELNTLGDRESRQAYRGVLVDYLSGHKDKLSEDSLNRLERNPMRILDSKNEGDKDVVKDAPLLKDHLNQVSTDFFARVREGLDTLGIPYAVNDHLVRGLDYYTHTAFEFVTTELGAQGAVLAGGRYDGLIETLGGKPTPGIGWAAGIERLSMMVQGVPNAARPIAVVPIGEAAEATALQLADRLRKDGFHVELGYGGSVKKRMKRANRVDAACAILMGEDELARNAATVRDLDSGEQKEVLLEDMISAMTSYRVSN